jgi:hypothetical protein
MGSDLPEKWHQMVADLMIIPKDLLQFVVLESGPKRPSHTMTAATPGNIPQLYSNGCYWLLSVAIGRYLNQGHWNSLAMAAGFYDSGSIRAH